MRKECFVSLAIAALACSVPVSCSLADMTPGNTETNDPRGMTPGPALTNSLGMEFVPVAGTEVLFSKWETRVRDFEAFVKDAGYDATEGMYSFRNGSCGMYGDTWESPGFQQGATHPVCGVSWNDANAFCEWLTKKEQASGLLAKSQKYRLPRDWEWSVAVGLNEARSGSPKLKDKKISGAYPWGTSRSPPKRAGNYAGEESELVSKIDGYNDGYAWTSPVGSFSANKHGLYDIGGNVWEWCEDFYNAYGGSQVLRGGSWCDVFYGYLLSSCRLNFVPGVRDNRSGFRCVVESSSE